MTISSYYPNQVPVFQGLAADTKPVLSLSAPAGSKFIETDTGNVWLLLNTGTWSKVLAGTSGAVAGTAAVSI